MSDYIPESLKRQVRERAGDRCEYCRLSQTGQEATFHTDHIKPRRLGGKTLLDNLALACVSCSLRKGARVDALDPQTGETVLLFHPRIDRWSEHFHLGDDCMLSGRTPVGHATLILLRMNRPLLVAIRQEEAIRGRYSVV